jgi:hypothetical protein
MGGSYGFKILLLYGNEARTHPSRPEDANRFSRLDGLGTDARGLNHVVYVVLKEELDRRRTYEQHPQHYAQ